MDPVRIAEYHATRPFTDKSFRSACYAPHVSMYFDTLGNVLACCQNTKYAVGNVTKERLPDIWHGERTRKLRQALQKDRFGAGCQFCEWQISVGNYVNAFTRNFDQFPVTSEEPDWPQMMEFTVSNTCNLECIMCYGLLSSSIRAKREGLPPLPKVYGPQFFEDLREFLPHLKFAKFLGGEPFLAAESFRIWDVMHEVGAVPVCNVTTNGTQWNQRVEQVLERFPISMCVSIDGMTKQTVESIRVNAKYETVMENVRRFRAYTREKGTDLTLTYCLMRQNWHEFGDYLQFADELDCGVCVNLVREPPECSLYTMPVDELAKIAEALEKQGETLLPRLGRNRRIWVEQVTGVRRRVEHSGESTRTPFDTPLALVVIEKAKLEADPNRMTVEKATALLRDSLGHDAEFVTFNSDQDDRLQSIASGDGTIFGLPGDTCIGQAFAEVVRRLSEKFGPLRTQQIHRTSEYVDRAIQFHQQDGGLLAVRFIAVPKINEFGMPAGSVTVAAAKEITAANVSLSIPSARASLADWDPDAPVLEVLLDCEGKVESVPADVGDLFDLAGKLRAGMSEAELTRAFRDAWGSRERVHGVAGHDSENIVHRFDRKTSLWVVRSITIPRFDPSGRHVGFSVLLSRTIVDPVRAKRTEDEARARLQEWAGCEEVLRIVHNRSDEVVRVQSPPGGLFGLDETSCLGKTGEGLAEVLRRQFGPERLTRWILKPDSLDVVVDYSTKDGYYAFRSSASPQLNESGHYVGSVRIAVGKRFGLADAKQAEAKAREILCGWIAGDNLALVFEDRSGRIESVQAAHGEFAGIPIEKMFGKTQNELQALFVKSLGAMRFRLWDEKADWFDVIIEYTKPGLFTTIRCISIPYIDNSGECAGKLRLMAGRSVDFEESERLEAKAIEVLRQWSGEDRRFRIIEDSGGIMRSVEGPSETFLQVPLDFLIGRSGADFDRELKSRHGEGRFSLWQSIAGWQDMVRDHASEYAFVTYRCVSFPFLAEASAEPCLVRLLTERVIEGEDAGRLERDAATILAAWTDSPLIRLYENRHGEFLQVSPADAEIDGIALGAYCRRNQQDLIRDLQARFGPYEFKKWEEFPGSTDAILEFHPPGNVLQLRSISVPIKGGENKLGSLRLLAIRRTNDRTDDAANDVAARTLDEWDPSAERLRVLEDQAGMIVDVFSKTATFMGIPVASLRGQPRSVLERNLVARLPSATVRHRLEQTAFVDHCVESRLNGELVVLRSITVPANALQVGAAIETHYAARILNSSNMSEVLSDCIRQLATWSRSSNLLRIRENASGIPIEVESTGGDWIGKPAADFLGRSPSELADQMQAIWGRMQPWTSSSGSVFDEITLVFHSDRGRMLVRNVVVPDLQDPGNQGGSLRLVASRNE